MVRSAVVSLLMAVAIGASCFAQEAPYDNAPDFILNATLSQMTSPPCYNIYVQQHKYEIYPIDIWYRLKFDDSGGLVSKSPVYSTRNDSALIRSIDEFPGWSMFNPGPDISLKESGYLVRIGLREWRGRCNYEAVPEPPKDSSLHIEVMPELQGNDSIPLPRFFYDPTFQAQTKVEYFVNEFGDVCASWILESSGMALFDLYALDVAETWHYSPAIVNGQPTGIWMNWLVGVGKPPEIITDPPVR